MSRPQNSSRSDLSDQVRHIDHVTWADPPEGCIGDAAFEEGTIAIKYGVIQAGPGAGVQVVEIDNGPLQITLLPTRGMSIWQVVCEGIPFKWDSPVKGPVHPALVPTGDPGGIGWLEGFDEFMVRCGLVSNGAPEFDELGRCQFPLHGRVANLPASHFGCGQDETGLSVSGIVNETRLFFHQLQLLTELRIEPGSKSITIVDTVTNLSSTTSETQMLYHINTGTPVVGAGARWLAPVREMAPRDERAAADFHQYNLIEAPRSGYAESVFFCQLIADTQNRTLAMVQSAQGDRALGIRYDASTLPCFNVWKNTADLSDGYVVGLEPATNFPNGRSFESTQRRVVELPGGESVTYQLTLQMMTSADEVKAFADEISQLSAASGPAILHDQPKPGWSDFD